MSFLGPSRSDDRVRSAREIDEMVGEGAARDPHGRVIRAGDVPNHRQGSRPIELLEDPRRARATAAGLPREAQQWRGSGTLYAEQELPRNVAERGASATGKVVSAAELDQYDQTRGTSYQPPPPGAYDQGNGTILLVGQNGQERTVTHEEYRALQAEAQHRQAQGRTLTGRILGHLRGNG